MGRKCSIRNCANYGEYGSIISIHKLPNNEEKRSKWLTAISAHISESTSKGIYICSEHFVKNSYQPESYGLSKRMLKSDAVPTIFNASTIMNNNEDGGQQDRTVSVENCSTPESSKFNIRCNTCPMQKIEMIDIGLQVKTRCVNTETQVSPKRLKLVKSGRELQLGRENRILKKRLYRREKRIMLMKHLRNNNCDTEGD